MNFCLVTDTVGYCRFISISQSFQSFWSARLAYKFATLQCFSDSDCGVLRTWHPHYDPLALWDDQGKQITHCHEGSNTTATAVEYTVGIFSEQFSFLMDSFRHGGTPHINGRGCTRFAYYWNFRFEDAAGTRDQDEYARLFCFTHHVRRLLPHTRNKENQGRSSSWPSCVPIINNVTFSFLHITSFK